MGIVSYAQNFEDVMLWRALKDVKNGFYIDVGANHPTNDSITKAFYENGWSGINVEPELELFELLNRDRPRDLNLNKAISSSVESIELYVKSVRGWSAIDKNSAANARDKNSLSEKRVVKAISLDNLCKEYNVDIVHFLKIDANGAEKDVLESFSFDKVRPWICIIETIRPTTQVDISKEWEYILLDHDYSCVYIDGLSKYYLADEYKDLADTFKRSPNTFDDFILAKHRDIILELSKAEANKYFALYNGVVNSNSWKMTELLRQIGKIVRWFSSRVKDWITFFPTICPERILKQAFISLKKSINNNPKLKTKVMKYLKRFPALERKMKQICEPKSIYNSENHEVHFSSSRAKFIFQQLEQKIKKEL